MGRKFVPVTRITLPVFRDTTPHILNSNGFIKMKETPTDISAWGFEDTDGAPLGNDHCAELSAMNKSHRQSWHELCQASPRQQAIQLTVVS